MYWEYIYTFDEALSYFWQGLSISVHHLREHCFFSLFEARPSTWYVFRVFPRTSAGLNSCIHTELFKNSWSSQAYCAGRRRLICPWNRSDGWGTLWNSYFDVLLQYMKSGLAPAYRAANRLGWSNFYCISTPFRINHSMFISVPFFMKCTIQL